MDEPWTPAESGVIPKLPHSVAEAIKRIASDAVESVEGGWGAGELRWALQGIAEKATMLCAEFHIPYESGEYDEETGDAIMTNEQYKAP